MSLLDYAILQYCSVRFVVCIVIDLCYIGWTILVTVDGGVGWGA